MLPQAVAGSLLVFGLVLVLSVLGIFVEFAGSKVTKAVKGWRKALVLAIGVLMIAWSIWSLLPREFSVEVISVRVQHGRYFKPCPKTIKVLVEMKAHGGSGAADYTLAIVDHPVQDVLAGDNIDDDLYKVQLAKNAHIADGPKFLTLPPHPHGAYMIRANMFIPDDSQRTERVLFDCAQRAPHP